MVQTAGRQSATLPVVTNADDENEGFGPFPSTRTTKLLRTPMSIRCHKMPLASIPQTLVVVTAVTRWLVHPSRTETTVIRQRVVAVRVDNTFTHARAVYARLCKRNRTTCTRPCWPPARYCTNHVTFSTVVRPARTPARPRVVRNRWMNGRVRNEFSYRPVGQVMILIRRPAAVAALLLFQNDGRETYAPTANVRGPGRTENNNPVWSSETGVGSVNSPPGEPVTPIRIASFKSRTFARLIVWLLKPSNTERPNVRRKRLVVADSADSVPANPANHTRFSVETSRCSNFKT